MSGDGRFPEHEKLAKISGRSHVIGSFLDSTSWRLCEWHDEGDNGQPKYIWREECIGDIAVRDGKRITADGRPADWADVANGQAVENPNYAEWDEGWRPVAGTITEILARHFGIDQAKLDAEKQQMLDAMMAASSEPSA